MGLRPGNPRREERKPPPWTMAQREAKVQKKKKTVKFFMLSLLLRRLSSDVGPLSTLIALMALSPLWSFIYCPYARRRLWPRGDHFDHRSLNEPCLFSIYDIPNPVINQYDYNGILMWLSDFSNTHKYKCIGKWAIYSILNASSDQNLTGFYLLISW